MCNFAIFAYIFIILRTYSPTKCIHIETNVTTLKPTELAKTDSVLSDYETFFLIFFGTCITLVVVASFVFLPALYIASRTSALQREKLTAMKSFVKVVTVEKPQLLGENSQGTLDLPIVKISFQPSKNGDSNVEYKLPENKIWEFPRKHLRFEAIVGEGAFGTVVKAQAHGIIEKDADTTVAVKMLKVLHNGTDIIDLVKEMEVMKILGHHKNVLRLLGCCTQGGPLLVIMEYVWHGNLKNFMTKHRSASIHETDGIALSENTLMSFAIQIAEGMEYLAFKGYVHRDLAARNVLVSENFIMKIADFGLARDVHNKDYYRPWKLGALPVRWMAPEALQAGIYTKKTDVWSFGILMWEMMTLGDTPYPEIADATELFPLLHKGYRMKKPTYCSEEIYAIMRNCWNHQPHDRPNFSDLVKILNHVLAKGSDECN